MRVLTTLMIAALTLAALPAFGYDVLVLQSLREKGYDEAVRGVRHECRASMRTVVMSDYAEADLTRIVREEHPKVIVAVGDRAVEAAESLRNVPVIYMMALNPRPRPNVTGVGMLLDPAKYLSVFSGLGTRKVGVVYDPRRSGAYLKRAQSAARRNNIEIVAREVRAPKETPTVLDSLRGKVDALWMLPDLTAVSPASTEAYFLFSQGEGVPVVTFAEVYLSMGGAVALAIDRYDIGRQVGEMAQNVLDGTPVEELAPQAPRRAMTRSNEGVLRRLKAMVGL